jgi:hypothetical protein
MFVKLKDKDDKEIAVNARRVLTVQDCVNGLCHLHMNDNTDIYVKEKAHHVCKKLDEAQ